jgi:superfamily II DNA or RNA helicase
MSCKSGSYLSKRGYVLKKENLSQDELTSLKSELKGRPLQDNKFNNFNKINPIFPLYIETKNKLYIPKMYGLKKYGPPDSLLTNYVGKSWDNEITFNGELYPIQIDASQVVINECLNTGGGILSLGTGLGKCEAFNTPILMFDGSIKMVQDIQVGDLLMGDDSTPRKVLSLARGQDEMYDIIPVKGEKHTVNKEHILCLKITGQPTISNIKQKNWNGWQVKWFENDKYVTKSFSINKKEEALTFMKNIKQQEIMEIAVKDYLKLSNHMKHILKGYKVPIEFPERKLNFDPYIIGLWLGDSTSNSSQITTQDSTILYYLINNLQKYNLYLTKLGDASEDASSDAYGYAYGISEYSDKINTNIFLKTLKQLDLINNKHIPMIYKCNSRENRLKLLAGLLDSNGYLSNDKYCFNFVQKNEKLIDDVVYLCRSLGFACYKQTKDEYKKGDYFRITISGNTHEIPTLCPRKRANKRTQIKDVLVTGITVKHIGKGDYYGFTLDGNNRYVIGDFTVTHNTISCLHILSKLRGKTIIIVNKIPLMKQWESEISKFLPDAKVGIIQGQKNINVENTDIIIAMLQSLAKIDYPDSLFQDIKICVVDEAHNICSRIFSQALSKLCCQYTIGLTATPNRSDGCEYIFKWFLGDIVFKSKMERVGLLPILNIIKIDSDEYKEISTINKINGQKQIQFTSMLSELITMPKRNKLVVEIVKDLIKQNRKILVLSDRRNHLTTIKKIFDSDPCITFTIGMFVGQMKISDLEKSKTCDVILATYSAFSEGVSVKELNTLLLITPKKFIGHLKNTTKNESGKMEQIVGRIFRKEHLDIHPMIVDLYDNFSVYKNQGNQRKTFYKQHFNKISIKEQSIDLDEFTLENINVSCLKSKNTKGKQQQPDEEQLNEQQQQQHIHTYQNCAIDE